MPLEPPGQEGTTDKATDYAPHDCGNGQPNEAIGRTDGSSIECELVDEAENCESTAQDESNTNGVHSKPSSVPSPSCWRGPPPSRCLGHQATLAGSFCPFGCRVSLRLQVDIARRMASQQFFTRPLIGTTDRTVGGRRGCLAVSPDGGAETLAGSSWQIDSSKEL
jgi:hypothetical protein